MSLPRYQLTAYFNGRWHEGFMFNTKSMALYWLRTRVLNPDAYILDRITGELLQ